jgi:GrpB-like predicted nucleotidyltransferase (UPF0157 family)
MPEDRRSVIYCLLAREAAGALADVRAHYRHTDLRVEVLVDHRSAQRRSAEPPADHRPDRRGGTDRRRFTVPRRLPPLPPDLAERTGPVHWVQRMMPVGAATEALSPDDVVAAVRAGDAEAPTELYWRFYERVHSRLAVLLGDAAEADTTVVSAFGRILDALDDPARALEPFDLLLYEQVEATADEILTRRGRPEELPDGGLGVRDPDLDEAVRLRDADEHRAPQARTERDRVIDTIGEHAIAVEHVGATAVPGLAGRATIDLVVGVERMPPPADAIARLEDAGYEDCGDGGTPGRVYLRRRGRARVDVHVVQYGSALWQDTLLFRDYLRRHPGEAQRWVTVKRDAARLSPGSAVRYQDLRRLALDELLDRARRDSAVPTL